MPDNNDNVTVKLNLHQKLLKIADAAGVLQRSKQAYGYKYVPEEDIQAKVTAGMQKYGVMLYSEVTPGTTKVLPHTYQNKKGETVNEVIVQADTVFTWVDTENPSDTLRVPWTLIGQMDDAAQAFGAGATYCNRYFLMKTLQLATSEADPDGYRSKQREAENYENDKAEKQFKEELGKVIKQITALGSQLIKGGLNKDDVYAIVSQNNDGNPNPSSIKTLETADKVLSALQNEEKKQWEAKKQ